MKLQKLYISKILPFLNKFKYCDIYEYEIRKIEQELAEAFNQKNIHTALDMPDFRYVKEGKVLLSIIKISIKKLNLSNLSLLKFDNECINITINEVNYQVIAFPSGEVPKINIKNNNLLFLMYQPGFKRVYYCGHILIEQKITKAYLKKFYTKHCEKDSQLFTDFNILERW